MGLVFKLKPAARTFVFLNNTPPWVSFDLDHLSDLSEIMRKQEQEEF